jgi:hypothetical protein
MFWFREKQSRFALPPRYGLLLSWAVAAIGVLAAMRFTALPLAK